MSSVSPPPSTSVAAIATRNSRPRRFRSQTMQTVRFLLPLLLPSLSSSLSAGHHPTTKTTTMAMAVPLVRAPPVSQSLHDEIRPVLHASEAIRGFGSFARDAGDIDDIVRELPTRSIYTGDTIPTDADLEDTDLCFRAYNHGHGLNLSHWHETAKAAAASASGSAGTTDGDNSATNGDDSTTSNENENKHGSSGNSDEIPPDGLYLASYRFVNDDGNRQPSAMPCAYGVVKDTRNRQVVVVFHRSPSQTRSSSSSPSPPSVRSDRDWTTSYEPSGLVGMRTPKKIASKMRGRLRDRVLVHEGAYERLFDNRHWIDGDQKYDAILEDIVPLLEEGYRVCVTGHGFGGALAQVFSFKLAGGGSSTDRIPRPVTCITVGAPKVGTGGYRAAFEQLELDGLLRCLRLYNRGDPATSIPTESFGFGRTRTMEHTGIGLRLRKRTIDTPRHSGRRSSSWLRSVAEKAFGFERRSGKRWRMHGFGVYRDRLNQHASALGSITLDGLYGDEDVMGKGFLVHGEVYSGYHKDEETELSDTVR